LQPIHLGQRYPDRYGCHEWRHALLAWGPSGSSSAITDSTGAKAQALTYFPYGGVRTNVPGTPVNVPYKFTGQEFDTSLDFYYYDSRYQDPWFGRFISPDTIVPDPLNPQDLNRYSYARNSPPNYIDPTGLGGGVFIGGCLVRGLR
jgi:RHS repeat-associated protein